MAANDQLMDYLNLDNILNNNLYRFKKGLT